MTPRAAALFILITTAASATPRIAAQGPALPSPAGADRVAPVATALGLLTADTEPASPRREVPESRSHFRAHFALGFVTSILAHEAGHVVAAYAVGGHPSFGFDKGRPTIFSGIDAALEPHRQFVFSSAGLTVQMLLDEGILDVPHRRGGSFERGLLAGGIATVLFYTTIGRNGSVSDIDFMSRTSSLSKTQISLIYGAVAAMHAVRIHRNAAYAHFFAAPAPDGGLRVGLRILDGQ